MTSSELILEYQAVCMCHLALFSFGNPLGHERVYQRQVTRSRHRQETQHRAAHVVTLSKRNACYTELSGPKRQCVFHRQEQS